MAWFEYLGLNGTFSVNINTVKSGYVNAKSLKGAEKKLLKEFKHIIIVRRCE